MSSERTPTEPSPAARTKADEIVATFRNPPIMKSPTIDELEAILNEPAPSAIQILPSGEVRMADWMDTIRDAITLALDEATARERERLGKIADDFAYDDNYRFAYKLLVVLAESIKAGARQPSYEKVAATIAARKAVIRTPEEPSND